MTPSSAADIAEKSLTAIGSTPPKSEPAREVLAWLEEHEFERISVDTWRVTNRLYYGFVTAWTQDCRVSGHLTRREAHRLNTAEHYSPGWAVRYASHSAPERDQALMACARECLGLMQEELLTGGVVAQRYGTTPDDERVLTASLA